MLATELLRLFQKAARMHEHSCGTLNKRLEHEGSKLVTSLLELLLQTSKAQLAVNCWTGNGNRVHQQRSEHSMKQLDTPNPDRTKRITMIGIAKSQKSSLRTAATKLPILKRLLQCDLYRS